MDFSIIIPEYVKAVLSELESQGIAAYIVGGSVRDSILGLPVHDYDVCACTVPDVLENALSDYRILETGKRYGTLTVISEGHPIEITCARRDGNYLDGRRPEDVVYTESIEEDLCRRDFTVNAMAYSEKSGLIDLFNGIDDCEKKLLRAVGEPVRRFNEDGLRIMRALRFSSVLGFEIEEETKNALHFCTKEGRLSGVSAERIYSELCGTLAGKYVTDILLGYSDVFCTVIPELSPCVGFDQRNPYHIYTVYEHIARAVGNIDGEKNLRLAMLFHDIDKPKACTVDEKGVRHFKGHDKLSSETCRKVLSRLKADNATVNLVSKLVLYHDTRPENEKQIRRYAAKVSLPVARMLCKVRRADTLAQSEKAIAAIGTIDDCEKYLDVLEKENFCLSIGNLAVKGEDLISSGIEKGPKIGETLQYLLDAVLEGNVKNEKKALLDYLNK